MKKIILFLLVCAIAFVPAVQAEETSRFHSKTNYLERVLGARVLKREQQARYSQVFQEQLTRNLQTWAKQGDAEAFSRLIQNINASHAESDSICKQGRFLMTVNSNEGEVAVCVSPDILKAKDHLGNNLLHQAKDLKTITVIGNLFRTVFPNDFTAIQALKDEKNNAQETPLIAHVGRQDLSSFFQLYEGSQLDKHIRTMENMGFSGADIAWNENAQIIKAEIYKWGTNAAGVNVAQLVQAQEPTQTQVTLLRFFKKHAPYLLD